MHNNIQQTTFWSFLKKRRIEIPIIQRDYAQGRFGKEKLREKFLTDMKRALDAIDEKDPENTTHLKLDFVYGSVENNRLNPLDGQQRLTTLWLLHWFLAYKSGVLSNYRDVFKNFTYETRTTSREFCYKLSEFNVEPNNENVVEIIQNQTWFISSWKQDPTIQSMLNMLGGTPIKDDKENEIVDGIEEVFCGDLNYLEYWEKLISKDCPIIFYYLDLLDLTLSDDLYIKMNARGKPLSNFENFKADLVGYIDQSSSVNIQFKPEESFAHKLDTKWTDIFWKCKSSKYRIDEIYYAFFNRYFFNKVITENNFSAKELETNKLFKYLYGISGDDTKVLYNGFDVYGSDSRLVEYITSFEKMMDGFHSAFGDKTKEDIVSIFSPSWDANTDFRFIPWFEQMNDKIAPTTLTQPQRVVFFAACCYFEIDKYDKTSFQQWMRVVWNIVENANIDTIPAMVGAMRLIKSLAYFSHEIYTHLKDRDVSTDFAKEQMEEEKEKARKIDENNIWENKIIEAEKAAFFKGAIRFLYKINVTEYDWGKFEERLKISLNYFNSNGVTEVYKKDSILLRFLVSIFENWEHFYPWNKYKIMLYYDNEISNWKTVLTHNAYCTVLNSFFEIDDVLKFNFDSYNSSIKSVDNRLSHFQNDLCKTTILNHVFSKSYFHWWNYNRYSLFPHNTKSQAKIFVFADKRNEVLSKLEDKDIIKVDDWQKVDGLPYFKGWEIYFTLKKNGKRYQWWDCLKEQTETEEWIIVSDVTLEDLEEYFS